MAVPEELDEFRDTLRDALDAGGFPSDEPPIDAQVEDGLILVETAVPSGSPWDGAFEDQVPVVRQERAQTPNEFLRDYLDLLFEFLTDEVQEGVDLDAAIIEAGGEPVAPAPDEEDDDLPRLSGVWADIRDIALDQQVPKEDREIRIGERLEDRLFDRYPEQFDDLLVGLNINMQAGQDLIDSITLELGGSLSRAGDDQFLVPPVVDRLTAEGDIKDPEAVWEDFLELVAIFDPEDERFTEIERRLRTIIETSSFRIEEGLVDFDTAFLASKQINEIALRNFDLWKYGLLSYMKQQSKAWWAAQRVIECKGNEAACNLIEAEISGTNRRGHGDWYLKRAYQLFLEGEFDPGLFVTEWHDVFRPGESREQAQSRRGQVNLDTLGRPDDGADTNAETEPTPEPEPKPSPPEPEQEGDNNGLAEALAEELGEEEDIPEGEDEIQDLADRIRDRL